MSLKHHNTNEDSNMNRIHTLFTCLNAHGIESKYEDGKLYANDSYVLFGETHDNWLEVSNMDQGQLNVWLGY